MGFTRQAVAGLATVFALAWAAPAFAQDYQVSSAGDVGSNLKTIPGGATTVSAGDDTSHRVDIGFDFPYYGGVYDHLYICSNGYLMVGAANGSYTSWTPQTLPNSSPYNDGMVAPFWDDISPNRGGAVQYWVEGNAPDRIFVAAWTNVPPFSGSGTFTMQVHLHETSGRIVFSYGTFGSPQAGTIGIVAPTTSDNRFVPALSASAINSRPTTDVKFDPDITRISGRLLIDKIVADENGFGNTVLSSQPGAGAGVSLVLGSGKTAAAAVADANGDFVLEGKALDSRGSGSVRAYAQNLAVDVTRTPQGLTHDLPLVSSVDFGSPSDLGTLSVDGTNDTNGLFRGAMNIAQVMSAVRDRVLQHTNEAIPRIEVVFQEASSASTNFTPATADDPSLLRVGSSNSSNPDAYDDGVLTRLYAHHVLESLTGGASPSTFTTTTDAATSPEDAFCAGFGAYLHAWLTGATSITDATSANRGSRLDLEAPSPSTAKAPNVPIWAMMAMFDLLDGANEAHDQIDGSSSPETVIQVIDALTSFPTPATFYETWGDLGNPGTPLSTNFIHHGLVGDDTYETNDSMAAAKDLGILGFRKPNLTLNLYNSDWYRFTVSENVGQIKLDVVYDRLQYTSDLTVQIQDQSGAVLANGALDGIGGPWRAATGAAAPGTYFIRITHNSGDAIGTYAVQCYAPLGLNSDLPDWTVGLPYLQDVPVSGGIQPYTMKVAQIGQNPAPPPTGLALNSSTLRVAGTPTEVGTYQFVLQVDDSAVPPSSVFVAQEVTINDVLRLSIEEFTTLALGKPIDITWGSTGGTPPLTVQPGTGVIPDGLTLSDTELRISGTPTSADSGDVRIEASDAAGSEASSTTTVIVCQPAEGSNIPIDLAAGKAVGGIYVDAIKGSELTLKVKTAKKRAKRDLRLVVNDDLGQEVKSGVLQTKKGKIVLKNFVMPRSGRFFIVISSDDGEASQILGTPKIRYPTRLSDANDDFGFGDSAMQISFGALAGTEVTLKGKMDRRLGNGVQLQAVLNPLGQLVPRENFKISGGDSKSITISGEVDVDGTWTFLVSPKQGPRGPFRYTIALKHPKGGEFVAD